MNFNEMKQQQLDAASTCRVYGHAVKFEQDPTARRWRPVQPCLCVQDSPDNPCQCPPRTWWLRNDTILAEGDAGRKDADGNELRYFDVFRGSQMLVESMKSVTLKPRGRQSDRLNQSDMLKKLLGRADTLNQSNTLKKLLAKIRASPGGGITDPPGGRGTPTSELMGWDDILVGLLVGIAGSAIWEGIKSLGDGDDDECYDMDSDSFYRC